MDLSKLPHRTGLEVPQAPTASPPETSPAPIAAAPPLPHSAPSTPMIYQRSPLEAYFGIAIGVILLLIFPRFGQWACSELFGTHFNQYIDSNTGAVIPYPSVADFWPDLGCALFGLTLIIDGVSVFLERFKWVVWMALGFTAAATAYNAWYVVSSFGQYGLALISAIAALLGPYLLATQWRALRPTRAG